MKKIFITIFAAAAVLTGCNRTLIEEAGRGQFSVEISASDEYNSITKAVANEDVNSFKVSIVRSSDGSVAHSYEKFADMPQVIEMLSGSYTINVSSPLNLPAAFDQPVYGASHDFVVKVGEATSEKIVCTLQNVKVSFTLSEAFRREISTYTISVSNGDAVKNKLFWTNVSTETEGQYVTKDVTRPGYFSVEPLTIHVDGKRSIDGSETSHEIMITNPNAKDHFIISLDAKVTGSAGFGIEIDPSVNVRDDEDVYIPGFDEDPVEDPEEDDENGSEGGNPGSGNEGGSDSGDEGGSDDNGGAGETPANDMTMTWAGHESVNNVYPSVNIDENLGEINLLINVPGKIAGFVVKIESESQDFMDAINEMVTGGGNNLDLINDQTSIGALGPNGVGMNLDLAGKENVNFELTGLVPMISMIAMPGTDHVFTLTVTDLTGYSETWQLTFRLP